MNANSSAMRCRYGRHIHDGAARRSVFGVVIARGDRAFTHCVDRGLTITIPRAASLLFMPSNRSLTLATGAHTMSETNTVAMHEQRGGYALTARNWHRSGIRLAL